MNIIYLDQDFRRGYFAASAGPLVAELVLNSRVASRIVEGMSAREERVLMSEETVTHVALLARPTRQTLDIPAST